MLPSEKLQKILANAGCGSRRQMEQWISQGRVSVNGKLAQLGDRATLNDAVRVDGHLINPQKTEMKTRVLMYHKPIGEVCTRHDPEGRKTVFEKLPTLKNGRWINIGRLDINTSGLLLFTNDGGLANQLMHPKSQIEREYAVRIVGEITKDMAKAMTEGVMLEDGIARFEHLMSGEESDGVNRWYFVVVAEGRNRVVRRLMESQGLTVSRLVRVRFGTVNLPKRLKVGRCEELEGKDLRSLKDLVK